MTNFSNEIIPYFLYFILLLFYISIISKKKKENREKFNKFSNSLVDEKKLRSFLLDSERKLKALNELYRDNLIELNLYTQKTSQIATVKLVGDKTILEDKEEVRTKLPDILGRVLACIWIDPEFYHSFSYN